MTTARTLTVLPLLLASLLAGCGESDTGPTYLEAAKAVEIEETRLAELEKELKTHVDECNDLIQERWDNAAIYDSIDEVEKGVEEIKGSREQIKTAMNSRISLQLSVVENAKKLRDSLTPR